MIVVENFMVGDVLYVSSMNRDHLPENFSGCVHYMDTGRICYYKNKMLHREDGPAVIFRKDECSIKEDYYGAWYWNDCWWGRSLQKPEGFPSQ